jgi:hypothetical protein
MDDRLLADVLPAALVVLTLMTVMTWMSPTLTVLLAGFRPLPELALQSQVAAPTDLLITALIHGRTDAQAICRWILDAHRILEIADVDLQTLESRSRTLGVMPVVLDAMRYLSRAWNNEQATAFVHQVGHYQATRSELETLKTLFPSQDRRVKHWRAFYNYCRELECRPTTLRFVRYITGFCCWRFNSQNPIRLAATAFRHERGVYRRRILRIRTGAFVIRTELGN